jgi:hypothetical protein
MHHLQSSEVPEHFVGGGVLAYAVFVLHDLFEQAASRSIPGSLVRGVRYMLNSGYRGHTAATVRQH